MNVFIAQFVAFLRHRPFVSSCIGLTVLLGVANVFLWQWRNAAATEHDEVRRQGELLILSLGNRPHIETDLAAHDLLNDERRSGRRPG